MPTGRTKTSKCWEVGLGFKFKFEFEIRIQKKIKATLIQEYHGGSAGRGDLEKDILLGRRLPVQPKGVPRERNEAADALSKNDMDRFWANAPPGLREIALQPQ